jgi:hypothetical protein
MTNKFAAVPELGLLGGDLYAVSPMGIFETLKEAANCIDQLHSSFGYLIYPIKDTPVKNVVRLFGINAGNKTMGFIITGKPIYSFNLEN